ncbi:ABC transporter substrate-binding protein [Clostridium sp. KNHs205]|uniref:ABC transporter substrate-binding protein n=1 Tax=Clostridium sp. KNHs205 TaxID=1449050 RepID=UPI0006901A40|nr:ABC transporter substrate-binding protein [Clostridium sp. KNHs205]
MKRRLLAGLLSASMVVLALTGCGVKDNSTTTGSSDSEAEGKVYRIGINQLVEHDALDASYKGFVDALAEAGYVEGKNLELDYQVAQGDMSTAGTIATKQVNDKPDLILSIATPSAQAVVNATKDIPVLVTAVTDPASAGLVASNKAPGGNVSGTSDLTPVKKQIELLKQLVPDAKKIAVLYSSSEVNSVVQADLAKAAGKELGIEVIDSTVSNSNEIQQVVQSLVGKVDAVYAPTDNLIASSMSTVAQVANANNLPVICGEGGMVDNGGLATYGIDYYELGILTGKQAVKILEGTATTADMPIEYLPDEKCTLQINSEVAKQLGIIIPEELQSN